MSSSAPLIPKDKQGRAVCWERCQAGLRRLSPRYGRTQLSPPCVYLLTLNRGSKRTHEYKATPVTGSGWALSRTMNLLKSSMIRWNNWTGQEEEAESLGKQICDWNRQGPGNPQILQTQGSSKQQRFLEHMKNQDNCLLSGQKSCSKTVWWDSTTRFEKP
jgi:hypothetical protein